MQQALNSVEDKWDIKNSLDGRITYSSDGTDFRMKLEVFASSATDPDVDVDSAKILFGVDHMRKGVPLKGNGNTRWR